MKCLYAILMEEMMWRNRMRVLKYAILGLLDQKELSGYDITRLFKEEVGNFWSAKHSQIYPELKRLTEEGFIRYETVIQGKKLEKKMYSITEEGRAELSKWLTTIDPIPETTKDEFMLKAYFASSMSIEELKQQIDNQLSSRKVKLTFLKKRMDDLLEQVNHHITVSSPQFGHYLVLSRAQDRETSYINWLERTLNLIEKEQ